RLKGRVLVVPRQGATWRDDVYLEVEVGAEGRSGVTHVSDDLARCDRLTRRGTRNSLAVAVQGVDSLPRSVRTVVNDYRVAVAHETSLVKVHGARTRGHDRCPCGSIPVSEVHTFVESSREVTGAILRKIL